MAYNIQVKLLDILMNVELQNIWTQLWKYTVTKYPLVELYLWIHHGGPGHCLHATGYLRDSIILNSGLAILSLSLCHLVICLTLTRSKKLIEKFFKIIARREKNYSRNKTKSRKMKQIRKQRQLALKNLFIKIVFQEHNIYWKKKTVKSNGRSGVREIIQDTKRIFQDHSRLFQIFQTHCKMLFV